MKPSVRKAVIPMAGKGTRFRPVTHVVPKEFLPILNKPLFHYMLDDIEAAGCDEVICVVSPGRDLASEYVAAAGLNIRITIAHQEEALGLGHAVLCAAEVVHGPFFVMLPDILIEAPKPVLQQMQEVYLHTDTDGVVALRPEPPERISRYGVVAIEGAKEKIVRITGMVEKPTPEDAPTDLTLVGQYLLPHSIFEYLRDTKPGVKGEIQLTDALRKVAKEQRLHGLVYEETTMFDAGQPPGWLAANVYYGTKAGLL